LVLDVHLGSHNDILPCRGNVGIKGVAFQIAHIGGGSLEEIGIGGAGRAVTGRLGDRSVFRDRSIFDDRGVLANWGCIYDRRGGSGGRSDDSGVIGGAGLEKEEEEDTAADECQEEDSEQAPDQA
jgi:hypothetical protein